MPRETRCTAGDETYRGRRVGSGRHGKTEWGKGVPLTGSKVQKRHRRQEAKKSLLLCGARLWNQVHEQFEALGE